MEESTLTRTARTLKSELTVVVLFLVALTLGVYIVYSFNKTPNTRPKVSEYQNGIEAGQSSRKDVEETLGKPQSVENDNTYVYPTENNARQDEIIFSNDKVSLIKEQVLGRERGLLRDFISNYGNEEAILFGGPHGSFAPGYFWGQSGIMVFANRYDGAIIEIWYFQSTTKENFISSYPEFSQEEESHPEQFTLP